MILEPVYNKEFVKTLREHIDKYNPDWGDEYKIHSIKSACLSFIRQELDTLTRETLTKEIIEEYKKDMNHLLDEYFNCHLEYEQLLDSKYGKK